jgi:hypothetical protein
MTLDSQQVERFATLFTGRADAYGTDTGGAKWATVTNETYDRHLNGVEPIGIYPVRNINGESMVCWGCCDIDTGDWSEAFMLATALQGMGLKPFVERSRSKGWHIWIFVDQWVPAATMRRALKVAYAAIDLPAKEANPKSEQLRATQLGNYVRLPYKGAAVIQSGRQCIMHRWSSEQDGQPLSVDVFLAETFDPYSNVDRLKYWAAKWYEPPRRTQNVELDITADVITLADRLPLTWRNVWLEGKVRDRSATFVALAYDLAKRGWRPQDVFNVLWYCPWNKYRERYDGEVYVKDIVERAFS